MHGLSLLWYVPPPAPSLSPFLPNLLRRLVHHSSAIMWAGFARGQENRMLFDMGPTAGSHLEVLEQGGRRTCDVKFNFYSHARHTKRRIDFLKRQHIPLASFSPFPSDISQFNFLQGNHSGKDNHFRRLLFRPSSINPACREVSLEELHLPLLILQTLNASRWPQKMPKND